MVWLRRLYEGSSKLLLREDNEALPDLAQS
jgi:hypothetical protein